MSYNTKKIIVIVLLLTIPFFYFPAIFGVILMWAWLRWKTWLKVLLTFLIVLPVLIGGILVYTYTNLYRTNEIRGSAMNPNYVEGEYYASKVIHQPYEITRGDVVIFSHTTSSGEYDIIKRVIGLPGEQIEIREGSVYINEQLLDESSYLSKSEYTKGGDYLVEGQALVIPAGSYFVLGDNRDRSSDSREFGLVIFDNIISKPQFCYFNCN